MGYGEWYLFGWSVVYVCNSCGTPSKYFTVRAIHDVYNDSHIEKCGPCEARHRTRWEEQRVCRIGKKVP